MKTLQILLTGGAILITHSTVLAETHTGFYVGGNIGSTELIDYELYKNSEWKALTDNFRATSGNSSVTDISISDPEDKNSETSTSLFAGIRLTQLLGVEAGLAYHGKATSEMSSNLTYVASEGQFTESLTAEAETLTYSLKASVNLYWELPNDIEVYGKLGGHYWIRDYEENVSYQLTAPDPDNSLSINVSSDFDEKELSPFIGLGLQWRLAPNVSLRLEAEYLVIDSDKRTDWDMQSYSLGFVYRFGVTESSNRRKENGARNKATACNEQHKDLFRFCN